MCWGIRTILPDRVVVVAAAADAEFVVAACAGCTGVVCVTGGVVGSLTLSPTLSPVSMTSTSS